MADYVYELYEACESKKDLDELYAVVMTYSRRVYTLYNSGSTRP